MTYTIFLIIWFTWNALPDIWHPDNPDFSRLNLILSIEAGFTFPFMLMIAELQRKRDMEQKERERLIELENAEREKQQLQYMQDMMETILFIAIKLEDYLDTVQ
ncbi:MAG: DUF1003 domain-containing protein [Pseudomonadota bacterium]|nr:DUF1003 domain-containing protein [Pseudomonadota bacterium]